MNAQVNRTIVILLAIPAVIYGIAVALVVVPEVVRIVVPEVVRTVVQR